MLTTVDRNVDNWQQVCRQIQTDLLTTVNIHLFLLAKQINLH